MFVCIMLEMKPVKPSTAACQRPGTSSRFMPPSMNSHSAPSVITIHRAELVKAMLWPAICQSRPKIGSIMNWCIGSILPDSAATRACPLAYAKKRPKLTPGARLKSG
jgi:hypothetical protein